MLFFTLALRAEHYRFKHYGREDGISTGVTQLLQDRTGFLWVATTNGLFRFDGARFLPFGAEAGLTSNWIRNLHQSADGTLWVVTSGGLERQNGASFESVVTGAQTDFSAIGSGAGRLYLGYDHGLLAANLAPGSGRGPGSVGATGADYCADGARDEQ
jgi:ligand-binding sensor domain-containing protein